MAQMPTIAKDRIYGMIAEFSDPADLLHAAEKVRDAGYKRWDCHSPFPVHGMDDAMGLGRSPVGFIVGTAALLAFAFVVGSLYWITAVDYKWVISGKPYFSYQAYVPVIFAVCVLTSAIVATITMIVLDRMPQWFHPLFESHNFTRFCDNGFFISIAAVDQKYDESATRNLLSEIGGKNIEIIDVPPDIDEVEE